MIKDKRLVKHKDLDLILIEGFPGIDMWSRRALVVQSEPHVI